jgi:hypothetical protein
VPDIPVAVAGGITVALIVILGIFVYPALLRRATRGGLAIAALTILLAAMFYRFDHEGGLSGSLRVAIAAVIALAPLLVAAVAYRLQRGKDR